MSYSWGNDTASSWDKKGFSYGSAKKAYDKEKSYAKKKPSKSNDMRSAYTLSQRVMDASLAQSEKDLLKRLKKDDILIVPGQYDSVEKVLAAVKTPYTLVNERKKTLDPKQVVLINCPGDKFPFNYKGKTEIAALRDFVEDGGYLVSTDWALESLIMKGFPGYITRGGQNTSDDVVEVDLVASRSPYTMGLGEGSLKPVWWLESSSYPIKLLKKDGIDILLGSQEMKDKYGEMPVAVKFPVGDGRVIHVTSHFYLQTVKTKYDAQAEQTGLDFATKFIGVNKKTASKIAGLDKVSFGAMESAYTSVRFLHNVFMQKLKQSMAAKQSRKSRKKVISVRPRKSKSLAK